MTKPKPAKGKTEKRLINSVLSGSKGKKYQGKHILVIEGKVFTAKTGEEASKKFRQLRKKYPTKMPTLAYLPKEKFLILWR